MQPGMTRTTPKLNCTLDFAPHSNLSVGTVLVVRGQTKHDNRVYYGVMAIKTHTHTHTHTHTYTHKQSTNTMMHANTDWFDWSHNHQNNASQRVITMP